MERLRGEIERELGRFGSAAGLAELVAAWPAAVGEAISRNAWPARVARDGTLHVATSSSSWAFELALLEREILERLERAVGPVRPPRLRFAPGRLPEPAASEEAAEPGEPAAPAVEELQAASAIAAGIEHADLRELVARAVAASLASARASRRF